MRLPKYKERHEFMPSMSLLKTQSKLVMPVSSYTPRAVTDFMVKVVEPVLADRIETLPVELVVS